MLVKAYKYRLYPTREQQQYLTRYFGQLRYIYNHCLSEHQKAYEAHKADSSNPKPSIYAGGFYKMYTAIKANPETSWLQEVPAMAVIGSLRNLQTAYANTFRNLKSGKPTGFPRFKTKRSKQSIYLSGKEFSIVNNRLKIPKLPGLLKIRWSREIPSQPTSMTLFKTSSSHYYVVYTCQYQPTPKPPKTMSILGIDVGLRDYATLSTGEHITHPKHYHRLERRLAHQQRRLSRQKKGSNSYNRTKVALAKTHAKISNQRHDFLHKLTRKLIDDNQAIAIEDLRISNMTKNRHLAKSIVTSAWGSFFLYLGYKAIELQRKILLAPTNFPSTQLCSNCRTRPDKRLSLAIKQWHCPNCLTQHNRDHNASANLKKLAEMAISQWMLDPKTLVYLDSSGYEVKPG